MKITPVASTIGAEISDVDLTDLSDAELVDVQCALLAHKVVFFREQTLDDDSHMELVRRWGDPVAHPVHAFFGAEQTVGVVFNDEDHPPADGEGWHTDHSWADYIPDAAVLRAIDVPAVGGVQSTGSVAGGGSWSRRKRATTASASAVSVSRSVFSAPNPAICASAT